jgi:hypothetical protein
MRRLVKAALVAITAALSAPVYAQITVPNPITPPATRPIPPLGIYVMGTVGCVAVAPMAQTIILGRQLTFNEAYRTMFGCTAGPLGWVIADLLAPPGVTLPGQPPRTPRTNRQGQGQGRNIIIPGAGVPLVGNEILLQVEPGTPVLYRPDGGDVAVDAARNADLQAYRPHAAALAHRRQRFFARDVGHGQGAR